MWVLRIRISKIIPNDRQPNKINMLKQFTACLNQSINRIWTIRINWKFKIKKKKKNVMRMQAKSLIYQAVVRHDIINDMHYHMFALFHFYHNIFIIYNDTVLITPTDERDSLNNISFIRWFLIFFSIPMKFSI